MKRYINFRPAYDTTNFGMHPMHIEFVVQGEKGAIVFAINTGWYIDPHHRKDPDWFQVIAHDELENDPYADLCYIGEECPYLEGRPCVWDGVYGLTSERNEFLFGGFLDHGKGWLFRELEGIYKERYGK